MYKAENMNGRRNIFTERTASSLFNFWLYGPAVMKVPTVSTDLTTGQLASGNRFSGSAPRRPSVRPSAVYSRLLPTLPATTIALSVAGQQQRGRG